MPAIEVYKSLETPVQWRKAVPGFLLTSGLVNTVDVALMETPDAAHTCPEVGKVYATLRAIPDLSEIFITFDPVDVVKGADIVRLKLDIPEKFPRGYYKMHLVHRDADGKAIGVYEVFTAIDKAVTPMSDEYMTVESIRTQFADICGFDNKLLESLEIGVGDIGAAVQHCLEQWDSVAPRISKYSGHNFKYTELLRNGVLYSLLQSLTTLLGRNRMQYQAGGVSVDLEARADFFNSLKQEYEHKWRAGMAQIKAEENMQAFRGSLGYL
jgi:hypothetical protein